MNHCKSFGAELLFIFKKQNSWVGLSDLKCAVLLLLVTALYLCLQKWQIQKRKILVEAIRTEAWQGKSKHLFCDSVWFPTAASVNLCSNLWVSAIYSKLNCCLFYSVVVKAEACFWMLSRGNEGPRMLNTAADTTLFLKDPPLDLTKQNVTVIVKIYINGKELTRSRGYQIWQT